MVYFYISYMCVYPPCSISDYAVRARWKFVVYELLMCNTCVEHVRDFDAQLQPRYNIGEAVLAPSLVEYFAALSDAYTGEHSVEQQCNLPTRNTIYSAVHRWHVGGVL